MRDMYWKHFSVFILRFFFERNSIRLNYRLNSGDYANEEPRLSSPTVIFRGSRSAYERRLTVSLSTILAKILDVVNYRRFYRAAARV